MRLEETCAELETERKTLLAHREGACLFTVFHMTNRGLFVHMTPKKTFSASEMQRANLKLEEQSRTVEHLKQENNSKHMHIQVNYTVYSCA